MNTLTIYSQKYDLDKNIVNNGMSGKAFLDMDNKLGIPFICIDDALDYVLKTNTPVHRIEVDYIGRDGTEMFKKFDVVVK